MSKIVTFGELLIRLSAPGNERLSQTRGFNLNFGGGEANVAASLAMLGHKAEFVTKLPDNAVARGAVGFLGGLGIKTDNIVFGGRRMGLYFLETGASYRPSGVIYDRAGSAFAEAEATDFDFAKITAGADLFHISGITPAVSDNGALLAEEALKCAKANGAVISFDVNFRSKLWTAEKAASVLPRLAKYADICFANSWDAANLLDVDVAENADFETGARAMAKKYGFSYVAASNRVIRSVSANDYSAVIYSSKDDAVYRSKEYAVNPIVDRVGTGDAFAAGVLCGILDGNNYKDALEFGTASAVLKHTVPGDTACVTHGEVDALVGNSSLRVQR